MSPADVYNRIIWLMMWAPFRPATLNSKRFANARSAKNGITLARALGLRPTTLFDIGANESQWAWWWQREWPALNLVSFEPQTAMKPSGRVHRVALSDENGTGKLIGSDATGYIQENDRGEIEVARFKDYWIWPIPDGSVLKIDAEAHSSRALIGFGNRIHRFSLVIVEVCWDDFKGASTYRNQAADIWQFMLDSGFNRTACLDADYYSGHTNYCDLAFWRDRND